MNGPQNFDAPEDQPIRSTSTFRLSLVMCGVCLIVLCFALRPSNVQAAWEELEKIIGLKSEPLAASPAKLSEHEIEDLSSKDPQQQAELLVERSINHYSGAIELISDRVGGWCDRLKDTPRLTGLLQTRRHPTLVKRRLALS